MAFNAEEERRLKRIVLYGTVIALGSVGLKYNKVIGKKIFHASFWEASQSTLVDLIDEAKQRATRVAGKVTIGPDGEIEDIILEETHKYSETQIAELEEVIERTED